MIAYTQASASWMALAFQATAVAVPGTSVTAPLLLQSAQQHSSQYRLVSSSMLDGASNWCTGIVSLEYRKVTLLDVSANAHLCSPRAEARSLDDLFVQKDGMRELWHSN